MAAREYRNLFGYKYDTDPNTLRLLGVSIDLGKHKVGL